jgi:hypothetical protein
MGRREEIEKLTHGVNAILTLYIEVHDGIFAQSWWRSIPIPGLFKSIPFDRYEIQISKVEQFLQEIEGNVRSLYGEATPNEEPYLAVLHQYTAALLNTVMALAAIVAKLKGKTERKPYDMSAYNADVDAYQIAIKGYQAAGGEMNRQWRAYRAAQL